MSSAAQRSHNSLQCKMNSGDKNLVLLMWVLLAASVAVTWHTNQTKLKVAALKERILIQHDVMTPLKRAHNKAKEKQEARWAALMTLIQGFSTKIRNKELFINNIKAKIKEYVLQRKVNTTRMALDLHEAAECMVLEQQIKSEAKEGADGLIVETRNFVREFVRNNTPISVHLLYSYDKLEVQKLNELDQENPALVNHIRRKLWVTPSPRHVPYNLQHPGKKDRSEGQLSAFLDIFVNTTSGFFIECGALDGEDISNTLDFEERYNWTGALIEASPINFGSLITKKRKAILIPTCLSLEKHPTFVSFQHNHALSKIANSSSPNQGNMVEVHCMPFYSVVKALGRQEIDLFVLDIEGHEVEVMHTVPWDKVNILVMIAEFSHGRYTNIDMRDYMLKNGYRLYEGTKRHYWPRENFIFIKKGSKYDRTHP